jgi:hypothetical protein
LAKEQRKILMCPEIGMFQDYIERQAARGEAQ